MECVAWAVGAVVVHVGARSAPPCPGVVAAVVRVGAGAAPRVAGDVVLVGSPETPLLDNVARHIDLPMLRDFEDQWFGPASYFLGSPTVSSRR